MFDASSPAEAVAALARLDEGVGSRIELVAGIEASARAIAWLQARQIDLIAELAERPSGGARSSPRPSPRVSSRRLRWDRCSP